MMIRSTLIALTASLALLTHAAQPASAGPTMIASSTTDAPMGAPVAGGPSRTFSMNELVGAGHTFFGTTTRGIAGTLEHAISRWGEPNGYILGEEGAGAIVGGLRYGEGKLFTRDYGDRKVYWQGPTIGFDFGGDGARTMMLVYNLAAPAGIDQRFAGIDGSVYFVGGFGLTALTANNIVVVPIRSGVGARLGVNVGYLKFTPQPTWNPF